MKKAYFCFVFCVVFLFLHGCSNTSDNKIDEQINLATSSEISSPEKKVQIKQWDKASMRPGLKQIIEKGTLNVAMIKNDVDVFCETQEDGTLTGIDVEFAQSIASSLGVELVIDRSCDTYNKLTETLLEGSADLVVSTYSLTIDRAAYVNISKPYLTSRLGVMLNKQELVKNQIEKNPIEYMKSNPIKLSALKGSSHVKVVSEMFPNAEIVEMDTYKEICQAVRNSDVFGYLCGEVKFLFEYVRDPELALYTQVFVFSDALEKYCAGIQANNADLLQFVNDYIDSSRTITIEDVEEKCKQTFND